MCLAIYKPAGKKISVQHLRNGFESNPHGAGLAFALDGKVHISKGYFDIESFLAAYAAVSHLACVVHFRFATHGAQNEFNCHPWPACEGKYAVVHNGILNVQSTKEKSDTGHFVDLVLTPALNAHGRPDDPALRYLIEQAIGSYNKIVVLEGSGEATIYNVKSGLWKKGVWYSNEGFSERAWFRESMFPPTREPREMFPDHEGCRFGECAYCSRPLEIDELEETLCAECR